MYATMFSGLERIFQISGVRPLTWAPFYSSGDKLPSLFPLPGGTVPEFKVLGATIPRLCGKALLNPSSFAQVEGKWLVKAG